MALLELRKGDLVEVAETDDRLAAADSWLVRDGRVRALDRHRQRFFRACAEAAGVPPARLTAFWQRVLAELPRQGEWFPRVELCADAPATLRLRLRPPPPLSTEVRVWIADEPDPRLRPRRKGPDLPVLARLRQRALGHDAQEALLTTSGGLVVEAANSGVLWWEGDELCTPSPTMSILDSVTSGLIRERAERLGVRLRYRRRPVTHLDEREVWLVNALHGIRVVTGWQGGSVLPGQPARAPAWQQWLDGQLAEVADCLPAANVIARTRIIAI